MKHREEGTHYACNARLEAEGGKTRCCKCVPHENCGIEFADKILDSLKKAK